MKKAEMKSSKADEYTIKTVPFTPGNCRAGVQSGSVEKYWNEAGTKGISGLDKLISVLKSLFLLKPA